MPKTHKFEEATFKDDNGIIIEESISLNKLIELKEKDSVGFDKVYKGHLYCPDCHKVQLALVEKKFLRGFHGQTHEDGCSYIFEPVPTKAFTNLLENGEENHEFVRKKLNDLIEHLLIGNKKLVHPALVKMEKSKISTKPITQQDIKNVEIVRRLPVKLLTSPFRKTDFGKVKLFYGNVDVQLCKNSSPNGSATLLITSEETNKEICRVKLTKNVFVHLKPNIPFDAGDGIKHHVQLAIAIKLTRKNSKDPIKGTLYHSDYCVITSQ